MLFRPYVFCRHTHVFSHFSLKLQNCHDSMPVTKCGTVLTRHRDREDSGRISHQQLAGIEQQLQTTEYSEVILTIIMLTNEANVVRLHVDPVVLGSNPYRTTYSKWIFTSKSTKPANRYIETYWDIKAVSVIMITSMIEHGLVFKNRLEAPCTETVSKNKISLVIVLIIDLWEFEASWILFVMSAYTKNGTVIKYTITLNSCILEKPDQQGVQYTGHTTDHLGVCPAVMLAAGLSVRSEPGLYKKKTFLEHSKCGRYTTQYIVDISISRGKLTESQITTDLQNIITSQNTIYDLQKTTYCAQKEMRTSDSISESMEDRTVRANTCQNQNSFGRQIMIIKKSTTVMFVATRDQAIYNSYSGCIYNQTKIGEFFNVPFPDQSLFCHRHTETAWPSEDCAKCDCCCLTLHRTKGIYQIVFFRHIKNLLHKNVTLTCKHSAPLTTLLNVPVVTNGERATEKHYHIETCRVVSILFKVFRAHLSEIKTIECWTGLNLISFASFTFYEMGETVLLHICVSELATEHWHLTSGFTFRLWPFNGTREITVVSPQLSKRHKSYGTCRLLTNDYWRTKQTLRAKVAYAGRKETKCWWDPYGSQQIFSLMCQYSWTSRHNHRAYSGLNVVNKASTVQHLFRRLNRWGWEMTHRENIDDGDKIWLLLDLHPGTIKINGTDHTDEWLDKIACYSNAKYKVMAETILDYIRDKKQLCNLGICRYDKYIATNRETNEDNHRHKSARHDKYAGGVHGRVINSSKYRKAKLQELVPFSNCVQDELKETTSLGKCNKYYIKLETNHSQCTNENMLETTNRNNCNNEDGRPQRQRRGWRRVNSRLTRDLVADIIQCEIVSTPTVLPVGNRAYILNSTVQTDPQHSDIPRCPQTTYIAGHQQYFVLQAAQNCTSETSHQRSVFPETGHSGSTGTSHQRSVFPEAGHSGSTGTSHQRSVFPEAGHSGSTGTSHQRSVFPETGHSGSTGTSHQRSVFPETGHSGSTGTSHQRSVFPETGHSGSTGTSHQRSVFPETGHSGSTGTSHQRSVLVDADQSENYEPSQTPSLNQLSDVMINAGLTDKDIEDFLSSEADLESFILNSGFALELFSDFPVGCGLLSSVFGDKSDVGTGGEQAGVVLASGGTNSDQPVTAFTDDTPPPLYNNHLSFNSMPRDESHSHPCKALTPGPGLGLTKQSQNSHALSDYCQALSPSTSTASREISGNRTNTSIQDQCVIQVHSQDTVSAQGYGLPRGRSQHSGCHPEPMSVEVLTNGDLDFQENALDITDQAVPTQKEVGAEELGETLSMNASIPVSNTTDQCHSQPEAGGARRVQSIESPSVFKQPVNVQTQPWVRPQRQCHMFGRGINKRTTAENRGDVGYSGSKRKRSRLESTETHPACSKIRVKRKPVRSRLRKVSYNLRCRSASGHGRPKRW